MLMPVKVRAHFSGGPCDGADLQIDAPWPKIVAVCNAGTVSEYHYCGFIDGVAYFGFTPVEVLTAA